MRRLQAWLGSSLLLTSVLAAETEPPSIELLLYLAEWSTDADGQLIDPLNVPESDEHSAEPTDVDPHPPITSKPEYPR